MISALKKHLSPELKRKLRAPLEPWLIKRNFRQQNKEFLRNNKDHLLRVEIPEETLRSIAENNWLTRVARNSASQNGEDGIIAEILKTVGITGPAWCVEFGACDGKRDSNTWQLINECGWSGVLIEPEPNWFNDLKHNYKHRSDVYCFNRFVHWEGKDSLDAIFAETPLPRDFALLVVDIDSADYYVWEALKDYQPHVLSIEFQWLLNPSIRYTQPKDFLRLGGATLGALYDLAKSKGYELVCAQAWNAFFVRKDHYAKFNIKDNRPERMYYSHQEMRLFQGYDGTLRLCGDENAYWWKHHWKFQLDAQGKIDRLLITQRDIQVLPDGLRVFRPRHTYHCKTLALQAGKLDAARLPANQLLKHRRNVTSECGEDGILEDIFDQLGIRIGFAVDVGANDGKWLSQTYNLFAERGWSGIAIEKDPDVYAKLLRQYAGNPNVSCLRREVRRSGRHRLDALLSAHGAPKDIAFLSIDVEGNDYHLWSALKRYSPAVVAIDFNPSIANDIAYVQGYNAASPFGASLRALIALGKSKGYGLAAATDWNAIFVRDDLFSMLTVRQNDIDSMYYPPFEMRMMQTMDGALNLLTGTTLMRQDYPISFEDFQVLPAALRGRDTSQSGFGTTPSVLYEKSAG